MHLLVDSGSPNTLKIAEVSVNTSRLIYQYVFIAYRLAFRRSLNVSPLIVE